MDAKVGHIKFVVRTFCFTVFRKWIRTSIGLVLQLPIYRIKQCVATKSLKVFSSRFLRHLGKINFAEEMRKMFFAGMTASACYLEQRDVGFFSFSPCCCSFIYLFSAVCLSIRLSGECVCVWCSLVKQMRFAIVWYAEWCATIFLSLFCYLDFIGFHCFSAHVAPQKPLIVTCAVFLPVVSCSHLTLFSYLYWFIGPNGKN